MSFLSLIRRTSVLFFLCTASSTANAQNGNRLPNLERLYERVRAVVYTVRVVTEDSSKSGSAIANTESHLITNCHVVQGALSAEVIAPNKSILTVNRMGKLGKTDLCVLEVDAVLPQQVQIRTELPKVGERVFTVGSPLQLEGTLSEGIVSGLRTEDGTALVQTTAAISPGSSGGGLFDSGAKLIGITTFTLRNGQALNFAISSKHIQPDGILPIHFLPRSTFRLDGMKFGSDLATLQKKFPALDCQLGRSMSPPLPWDNCYATTTFADVPAKFAAGFARDALTSIHLYFDAPSHANEAFMNRLHQEAKRLTGADCPWKDVSSNDYNPLVFSCENELKEKVELRACDRIDMLICQTKGWQLKLSKER